MTKTYDLENDEGQNLPVPVPRCWAYNKQRQRCDLPGGHLGDHAISVSWSDQDNFDPDLDTLVTFVDKPIPFVPATGGDSIVTMNAGAPMPADFGSGDDLYDDLGTVPNGSCFSCGCLEEDHPCEAHGCRSFVP